MGFAIPKKALGRVATTSTLATLKVVGAMRGSATGVGVASIARVATVLCSAFARAGRAPMEENCWTRHTVPLESSNPGIEINLRGPVVPKF